MALIAAGLTQLAAGFTAAGATGVNPYISLHTAQPDGTGSSQTTHARLQATFTNTNGVLTVSAAKNFTGGAASGAVTYVGLWSALTAGTFYGWFIIPAAGNDQASNAAGAYTLNSLTITLA